MTDQVWYYAFIKKDGVRLPFYDRTFGYEPAATKWVNEDPLNRFITIKEDMPDDYYY